MPNTHSNADYKALLDDRKALAKHLEQYDRKLLVAFAFRNALRVLPVLGKNGEFGFWKKEDRAEHIQAVFQALIYSQDFLVDQINRKGGSRAAAAAADAADAADAARAAYAARAARAAYAAAAADAADAAAAARAAAYAARAAYAADAADAADAAARAAAARAAYAYAADAADADADARAAVIADLQCMANQLKIEAFLVQPLWPALPKKWSKLEANFQRALVDTLGETDGQQHYQQYKSWAAAKFGLPSNTRVALSPAHDDVPSAKDALGRTELVNALAAFCDHPQHQSPSIIALLGDWGAGKSSVIQQLKQRLGLKGELPKGVQLEHEFLYAELNAWEYENTKNMDAALAQEVVNGCLYDYVDGQQKSLTGWQRFRLMWRFNWRERHSEIIRLFIGGGISLAIIMTIAVLLAYTETIPEELKGFAVSGSGGLLAVLLWQLWTKGAQFLQHPLSTQLFTFFDQPSYAEHLGYLPSIRQQLHTLLKLKMTMGAPKKPEFGEPATPSVSKKRRLLMVVDDLDRCQPKAINETLDAVRLLLGEDINNVMVLVAVDYRIALNAVAKRFKKDASKTRSPQRIARDYLGKVVQSVVQLEMPSADDVARFVTTNLFSADLPTDALPVDAEPQKNIETEKRSTPGGQQTISGGARQSSSGANNTTTQPPPTVAMKHIQDTVEERDAFNTLAKHYDLTNPRQLKRLKNAFQLFRHVYVMQEGVMLTERDTVPFADVSQPILHMLFWVEYLHTLRVDEREGLDADLDALEQRKGVKKPPTPDVLFWPDKDAYATWFKRVEAFVLPAADANYVADSSTATDDAENKSSS